MIVLFYLIYYLDNNKLLSIRSVEKNLFICLRMEFHEGYFWIFYYSLLLLIVNFFSSCLLLFLFFFFSNLKWQVYTMECGCINDKKKIFSDFNLLLYWKFMLFFAIVYRNNAFTYLIRVFRGRGWLGLWMLSFHAGESI